MIFIVLVFRLQEDKIGRFLYLEFVCDPDHFYCPGFSFGR
jgi:hypothetical protein